MNNDLIVDIVQNNTELNRLSFCSNTFTELIEQTTDNIFCKFYLDKKRNVICFNYMKEWYLFDLRNKKYIQTINNCMNGMIEFNDNRIHIYKNDVNRFIIETIKIL